MSDYTDTLAALASSTDNDVQALYARFAAGELTEDEFVTLATAVLAQADARAVGMADVALASVLSVQRRRPVLPLGLGQRKPVPVLRQVITEALAADDVAEHLTVNVRAETLDSAQKAYGKAMRHQGVKRWTRKLNGSACPLCHDLAGPELPASAEMYTHKGCGCSQKPLENPA